jgi:hypothetical protein
VLIGRRSQTGQIKALLLQTRNRTENALCLHLCQLRIHTIRKMDTERILDPSFELLHRIYSTLSLCQLLLKDARIFLLSMMDGLLMTHFYRVFQRNILHLSLHVEPLEWLSHPLAMPQFQHSAPLSSSYPQTSAAACAEYEPRKTFMSVASHQDLSTNQLQGIIKGLGDHQTKVRRLDYHTFKVTHDAGAPSPINHINIREEFERRMEQCSEEQSITPLYNLLVDAKNRLAIEGLAEEDDSTEGN